MTDGSTYSESEMRDVLNNKINVRDYCGINKYKVLANISFQWVIITTCITVAVWSRHPLVYILSMLIICSRQHALGIIMHDATHYRLLKNRFFNDLISNVFCAIPILMITNRYRYYHLLHHKHINSDADPYWEFFQQHADWNWPKSAGKAASVFLRDLFGFTAPTETKMILKWGPFVNHLSNREVPPPLSPVERVTFYIFSSIVVLLLWHHNAWLEFLILWIIPVTAILMPLTRIRTIAEHIAIPGKSGRDSSATRHVDGTWLERVFISPCNINYHVAHHLFTAVPLYNLPKFHQRLLQAEEYRNYICHKDTYLGLKKDQGVLGEIIIAVGDPQFAVKANVS